MPTNKTIRRRTATRKAAGDVVDDDLFEDLDLDIGEDSAVAPLQRSNKNKKEQKTLEEDIVFDRRNRGGGAAAAAAVSRARKIGAGAGGDDEDPDADDADDGDDRVFRNQILAVHPREAHHGAKEGMRGAFGKKPLGKSAMGKRHADLFGGGDDDNVDDDEDLDESAIAAQMSRHERGRLAEEDYTIGLPEGLSGSVLPDDAPTAVDAFASAGGNQQDRAIAMQVNSVASQFAALSASDRLRMITQQSPEVAKLMEELEKNLADLRDVFAPLRSALFERKKASQAAGDSMLLEFLETKVQLMLSYCVHILFYLLLKVEGAKVEGHPVLKRLVELRVYLEKLHPVELRLQHSISRLLSGNASQLSEGARLKKVRAVSERDEAGKSGKYVARKTAPVIDDLRQRRRAEKLADEMRSIEKEEERTMQRKRMTRADAAKFSGSLDQVPLNTNMQEEEDQYLANASSFLGGAHDGDDDDDNDDEQLNGAGSGKSLIERLRARKQQASAAASAAAAANDGFDRLVNGKNNKKNQKELKKRLRAEREEDEDEMNFGEGDDFDGEDGNDDGDDEDVPDFDELEQEQDEREAQQRATKKYRAENPYKEPTSDRREVDERITKHRGVTKARPKDRKNPRANQRRKFNIGLRVAKAQSKKITDGANRETGSAPLKTHVVHSTKY